MRRLLILVALALGVTLLAASAASATSPNVIYNSVLANGPPTNLPSVGVESSYFSEFGNEINFSGTNRKLSSVVVTMSSFACVSGHWNTGDCSTPSGATFAWPITLNVYDVNGSGTGSTLGSRIATSTQTFSIPYRPSASSKCTGANAGEWYQPSNKTCHNGLASNITFNFVGQNVTLNNTAVVGIAYNTTTNGYNPIGSTSCNSTPAGCFYDSLNIALSTDPADVTVGSDTNSGTIWQNTSINNGANYCDSGAAGFGTFRLDSPSVACWTPYVPAIQVLAAK